MFKLRKSISILFSSIIACVTSLFWLQKIPANAANVIGTVNVQLSTPSDSKAKSTDTYDTLWITGKLLSNSGISNNSDSLELFKWAQVPAQSADAYRDVTVDVLSNDKVFRRINFPNAFVIDYGERYNDNEGVGGFSMTLRQKADKLQDVKAEGDFRMITGFE